MVAPNPVLAEIRRTVCRNPVLAEIRRMVAPNLPLVGTRMTTAPTTTASARPGIRSAPCAPAGGPCRSARTSPSCRTPCRPGTRWAAPARSSPSCSEASRRRGCRKERSWTGGTCPAWDGKRWGKRASAIRTVRKAFRGRFVVVGTDAMERARDGDASKTRRDDRVCPVRPREALFFPTSREWAIAAYLRRHVRRPVAVRRGRRGRPVITHFDGLALLSRVERYARVDLFRESGCASLVRATKKVKISRENGISLGSKLPFFQWNENGKWNERPRKLASFLNDTRNTYKKRQNIASNAFRNLEVKRK